MTAFPPPASCSLPEASPPPGLQVEIRPLAQEHLDQVAAIEQACFSNPWSCGLFLEELRMPLAMDRVVLVDGQVAAYCCLWLVAGEAQVQNLAVHPAFQRRGMGKFFLIQVLSQARAAGATRASLEVRDGNLAALYLYQSLGFCLEGRRPRYYQPEGKDALLLGRNL